MIGFTKSVAKELGGKLLRGDFKGAKDQLKGRAMELKNRFMPKKGPSGPSGPSGSDEHMESDARIGPLVAETAGSAAKAGMTLFKESIGAFISVMSNIAHTARNRMTRRINQYGLNRTRKLGDGRSGSSGNHGNISFNMNFDLDDPKQRSKIANLAGKMGDNIQKQLDSGKLPAQQPGMITKPQGEAGAPAGEGVPAVEGAPEGEAAGAPEGEGEAAEEGGEEIPIEEDHSDDWFKLIRKHYIVNGEIVESRALSQLKKRRSDDWDRFKSDPKANKHLITFTLDPKNPKKYLVKIKQCVLDDCEAGKIVIPKKATMGMGAIKGDIELFKTYTSSNSIVKKFIDILDAEKLSDSLKSNPDKKIVFYENQKKKKKGQKEEFTIKDIKKKYKYKFIPCVPIKSYSKIKDSFKTTDFHSTDNESCTKPDFDKFLEQWKTSGETMNSAFIEMMNGKTTEPLMIRMVSLKSSDEKEWKKQEKEGLKAEKAKEKAEKGVKSRGNFLRRMTGTETKSQKLEAEIRKKQKALEKAEENQNLTEVKNLQEELEKLRSEQTAIIDAKNEEIQKKSDAKKEKLAENPLSI